MNQYGFNTVEHQQFKCTNYAIKAIVCHELPVSTVNEATEITQLLDSQK